MVKSTRPNPHYSHGFRLPGARWDEAYEAAGVALDALGESRGEPWQTKAQAAVNRVVDDIQREWEEKEAATDPLPDQEERRSGNE